MKVDSKNKVINVSLIAWITEIYFVCETETYNYHAYTMYFSGGTHLEIRATSLSQIEESRYAIINSVNWNQAII